MRQEQPSSLIPPVVTVLCGEGESRCHSSNAFWFNHSTDYRGMLSDPCKTKKTTWCPMYGGLLGKLPDSLTSGVIIPLPTGILCHIPTQPGVFPPRFRT